MIATHRRPRAARFVLRMAACVLVAPLLATPPAVSPAPSASSQTLADYLQRAQDANPALEAFRQRYEAALARVPQARSLPDPTLQVTHFVESVQTRTGPQEQVVMLAQKLPWFGTREARAEAATAEAEALWFDYRARQLSLAREVAEAFYEYGYTARAKELTDEGLQLLEELAPVVEERVRGGSDLNPLLRLRVEMGKVQDRLRSLEEQRHAQSARLAALLDQSSAKLLPWPEWPLPSPAPAPSLGELTRALHRHNPELAALERGVASRAARRELARLGGFPDLSVGLNYIRLGEPLVPTTPDAGQDPWGLTVSVNLPLWRGRVDAARAEALASQRAAEATLAQRRNALEAELSTLLSRQRDAERRLALYGDDLLPLARQALENSQTSYQAGRAGILEVIDSERSLLELETLYWRAAADTWQARVALRALIGGMEDERRDSMDDRDRSRAAPRNADQPQR